MALEKQVYHLSATARRLPTGATYTRSGTTWARSAGRYTSLTANSPVWGSRGLLIEGAETNLMTRSIPNAESVLNNSGLFVFATVSPLIVGRDVQSHAATATANRPVRWMPTAPDVSTVTQDIVWAEVEMIDSEMVDIGWTDAAGNWLDCVRFTLSTGAATVLYGTPAAAAIIDSTAGLNGGTMIRVAAMKGNGHWDRFPAIAPAGTFQQHKKSVVHHLQVSQASDVNSPVVTEGSINTRARATLVSTIEDPGPAQTVSMEIFTGILAGSRRVIWQQDTDTDTGALSLIMEPGGRLVLQCGAAVLDLGKPNAQSVVGLAFNVTNAAIRARLNGGSVQTISISRPLVTRERWGGGVAAGAETGSLELMDIKRWLSIATDAELLTESTAGEAVTGVANVSPGGAAVYAATFSTASAPGSLLENVVVPSSGSAQLVAVYGGSGRTVYRKARSSGSEQELPWDGARRWENLLASSAIDNPVMVDIFENGGVSAIGATTHLGLACSYVTWASGSRTWANARCADPNAIGVAKGVLLTMSVEVACSRQLATGESIDLYLTGQTTMGTATISAGNAPVGKFERICLNQSIAVADQNGTNNQKLFATAEGTLVSDITVYFRRRMMFDATGMASSEYFPSFVDPAVDYGGGCNGVRLSSLANGNTVSATGRLVEADGAAISPAPGIVWHPTATLVNGYSPPTSDTPAVTNLTFAEAASGVAGLPAIRATATADDGVHSIYVGYASAYNGHATTSIVFRKQAGAIPVLYIFNASWNNFARPNSDYSAASIEYGTSHNEVASLKNLGNDCYELSFTAIFAAESSPAAFLRIAKSDGTQSYAGGGEYLDIAAYNVLQSPWHGSPMLALNDLTARVSNDPGSGLSAISSSSDFTVFVSGVLTAPIPAGTNPVLFGTDENFAGCLYMEAGGKIKGRYSSGAFGGGYQTTIGTPFKAILRRWSGTLTLFAAGASVDTQADSAPLAYAAPRFGPWNSDVTLFGAVRRLEDRLMLHALSDAACIEMTT